MNILKFSQEVSVAQAEGRPVVALESTVITHGLPYPLNFQTAKELENEVRSVGAVPATIAILDGEIFVGLDETQLENLAKAGSSVEKVSLWNLPALIARRASGGTTVAATVHLAHLAGLSVFATGGIGGVHHDPFDESADLIALSRTPVIVVSAGPKSILNLPATLERLETLGVPIIGYGTDSFPAFHSPISPYNVPSRLDTPEQIAVAWQAAQQLGLGQAMLVMNPVQQGIAFDQVQAWVEQANVEARRVGVTGKALTPYLLRRLSQLSNGETDKVNTALLRANAKLGGLIAAHLGKA